MDSKYEAISLALQFVASFCWAIGAILAGPFSAADYLQLFAAICWCFANFASLASFCVATTTPSDDGSNRDKTRIELATRL
jgi:hypothetical protein